MILRRLALNAGAELGVRSSEEMRYNVQFQRFLAEAVTDDGLNWLVQDEITTHSQLTTELTQPQLNGTATRSSA